MLLKKRIEVRRQMMAALIAINRRLESTNEDGLLDAAIMPIFIARRQYRKIAASEMVVFITSVRHHCRFER